MRGLLGCAGLTILMAASDRARHDHVRLALVVNTHPVRRALHVTGLAGNFDCYTERRRAVAA